jgi:hypothetical protein
VPKSALLDLSRGTFDLMVKAAVKTSFGMVCVFVRMEGIRQGDPDSILLMCDEKVKTYQMIRLRVPVD